MLIPKRRSLKLLPQPKIQSRAKMISVLIRCLKFHKMISTLVWLQPIPWLRTWISTSAETTSHLIKQIIKDSISELKQNSQNHKQTK